MANNRIFLFCKQCRDEDQVNAVEPVETFLAKTFLDGYYTTGGPVAYVHRLDAWFELHNHGLEYNIGLEYEHAASDCPFANAREMWFGYLYRLATDTVDRSKGLKTRLANEMVWVDVDYEYDMVRFYCYGLVACEHIEDEHGMV